MAGKLTDAGRDRTMKTGDSLNITTLVRSQKTGVLLPRRETSVGDNESLGRKLIPLDSGSARDGYLIPKRNIGLDTQRLNGKTITHSQE